jgi:predicted RNase H-like HicB family nuclease
MAIVKGKTMRQVVLIPDLEDGGYTVEVPSLPGCISEGDTVEEALENIKDAIQGYIESLEADGLPVPPEDEPRLILAEV